MSQRYNPDVHHRRSIRLPDWDHRMRGAYFVTLVTHERQCLFDDSAFRRIAEIAWKRIPQNFFHVALDDWVLMPNHLHGIIVLGNRGEAGSGARSIATFAHWEPSVPEESPSAASPLQPPGLQRGSLGAIVGTFKSMTAKRINRVRGTAGAPVWLRNYYEHVIRNDREWNAIREYIRANPMRWAEDTENPTRKT